MLINNESAVPKALFANLNVLIDSDVTVASYQSENFYSIQKVYQNRNDLPILKEVVGFWKLSDGFISTTTLISANRRKNLMGTTLNTSLVITHNDSLNHLLDKR